MSRRTTAPAAKAMSVPPSHIFCKHGRLPEGCEDCRFIKSVERGSLHPETEPAPEPKLAEHDLLLPTATPGRFRLVKAGDPIPEVGGP